MSPTIDDRPETMFKISKFTVGDAEALVAIVRHHPFALKVRVFLAGGEGYGGVVLEAV